MKRKFSTLVTGCCLACIATMAYGQGDTRVKTYAETRREQDNKAYNEAYLDDIRRQRNSSTGTGGVDRKAVDELAAKFRFNAGKGYDPQTQQRRRKLTDEEKAEMEAEAKEQRAHNNIESYYSSLEAPIKKIAARGVTKSEATYLATVFFPTQQSAQTPEIIQDCYDMVQAAQMYRDQKTVGGYEMLMAEIAQFKGLTVSALYALDEMEQRFPEKKEELDKLRLAALDNFWIARQVKIYGIMEDRDGHNMSSEEEAMFCLRVYENLYIRYPVACDQIQRNAYLNHSPQKLLFRHYYFKEKNMPKAFQWVDIFLATGFAANKGAVSEVDIAHSYFYSRRILFFTLVNERGQRYYNPEHLGAEHPEAFAVFKKYYLDKSLDTWKSRAEIIGIPVGYALQFPRSVRLNGGGPHFYDDIGVAAFDSVISRHVQTMLLQNDPEAMNAWGVMLAKRKDPDATIYINRAARAGSAWGIYNLTEMTKWGLPDFGAEKLEELTALQDELISKATKKTLLNLLDINKTLPQTWEYIHANLVHKTDGTRARVDQLRAMLEKMP